jgi:hypothetical protein
MLSGTAMRTGKGGFFLFMVFFGLAQAVPAGRASADSGTTVADDPRACLMCHGSAPVRGILKTPHFTSTSPRAPGAQKGCQSCHGPAGAHLEKPLQVSPRRFGTGSDLAVEKQNGVCLGCHQENSGPALPSSHPAIGDNSCVQCHQVHPSDG